MISESKQTSCVIFGLLFVSGACALIYQVVWTRMITQVFGSTVFAVSAVLAAFMTGLALGSYFLGKIADRSDNPLRLYAFYELGIGVSALLALYLLGNLTPFYLWLNDYFGGYTATITGVRYVVAFLIIIWPTILMGATLPVLSRFTTEKIDRLGQNVSGLYAVNTAGAVLGSLLAGFFLIKWLGIHSTLYAAVAANIIIGLVAWQLSKATHWSSGGAPTRGGAAEPQSPARGLPLKTSRKQHRTILLVLAVSGFTAFAYEIYWTRALVLIVGNSTYAFSTILSAFLSGIALGGWIIKVYIDKLKNPLLAFGWVEIFIGLTAAVTMPIVFAFSDSQAVQSMLGGVQSDWSLILLLRFMVSFVVMLVPTVLIGATFPLVAKIYATRLSDVGADVGKVYAVNTLGNIAGAIVPVFVILPLIGIGKGILIMAALNGAIGALILMSARESASARWLVPAVTSVLATVIIVLPSSFQFPSGAARNDSVLFYKEGIVATTKVIARYYDRQEKHIIVDGVSIGGTGSVDYKQQVLAHWPQLFLENSRSELSIGLGSGILIGESAKHGNLRDITVVEIAPSVVAGASAFAEEHGGIESDPRIDIVVSDGVNYLLTSQKTFDIISSDAKSKPEHGGNGVFFSTNYYQLALDSLSDSGMMIQWVPTHLPHDDYVSVLRSFTAVFPHASLWYAPPGNSFLIGSRNALKIDYKRVQRLLNDPQQPLDGLRKYGLTSAEEIFSHYVASRDVIQAKVGDAKLNSLEHPIIEFYSIRDYAKSEGERQARNLELMLSLRAQQPDWSSWILNADTHELRSVAKAYEIEQNYLTGLHELMEQGPDHYDAAKHYFATGLKHSPPGGDLRFHLTSQLTELAKLSIARNDFQMAENFAREATSLSETNGEAHFLYGMLLASNGYSVSARKQLEACVALKPMMIEARKALAGIYAAAGEIEAAIAEWRVAVELDPHDKEAARELERLLARKASGVVAN